jgi:uncharacterized protein
MPDIATVAIVAALTFLLAGMVKGVIGMGPPTVAMGLLSPVIGLLTGLLTGATGTFVIPAVPYFNALGLEKEELIQTLGLSFTASTLALAAGLLVHEKFELHAAGTSLLALLPALVGLWLGQRLRDRLKPAVFRRWFFFSLILLGSYLVLRALPPARSAAYSGEGAQRIPGKARNVFRKK